MIFRQKIAILRERSKSVVRSSRFAGFALRLIWVLRVEMVWFPKTKVQAGGCTSAERLAIDFDSRLTILMGCRLELVVGRSVHGITESVKCGSID